MGEEVRGLNWVGLGWVVGCEEVVGMRERRGGGPGGGVLIDNGGA